MSSRKESSCTNQNTLTTSIAKIGSAVNSPRNRLFQIRQQQTPVSSSSSIYNPPQRRVVNLDTWPNNAGSFDNNNAAMAQMYSSRWGVYDNTTFNIGYNDGGFSKLPPLNMNGIDNNSMNNVDHNQFSPKHTMMNNSPNMSPNNYMQQNMNNNPFTTVQTSNSNTLNDSLFHQNQQQQQNLNTHNNHQINVTMQNSNFHHTNNQINNTTTNFQTQHSQQPCIDLNTTSFNPQHTIEQQNNTNTFFQQSQQTQHNMDHRQTINSVNNTSNFQQQNIFNQFDQQQTEINSAIPQSLVDIVMEMEEETPEQTFEQMLTDHNKNIQNTCSYGNSPVPETFNDDSMMDISDMNDIFTNIPSIRPPSTWNFDIVEQNNKMNIENFGSSTSQLINELKKENLKAEPAVSINSLSTTSMITEQNSQNFQQTFENTQQTLQNQQDMKNSQLQQTLHSEQIFQQNRQNHQPFVQQSHRPNQQHAFQEQNSELSQKPQQTQQTQQTQQQFLNQQTQQTQENLQQNQKTKEQHQILQQNKQNNQQTSTPQRQEQQKYQQQQQQQQSQRQEEEEEEDIPSEIFDKNGETFLHLAIHNRDIKQCLEILETPVLNKAINVKNASKEVPILILLKKCFTQCDKILEKFLDLDVRVKAIDHSANNIFHLSISEAPDESQCLQILDILFKYSKYKEDYKWLMNQRNVSGYTPSHIATIRGYGKAIWKFHENEANLNLQDFQAQKTCLVMAAENQNWPLVTELIKMNVNVNVAARGDQRAINYAIKSSRADIITLLFEHDTECLKWKDIVPSEEIEKLVRKLIRKKRRKKKEGKVERE